MWKQDINSTEHKVKLGTSFVRNVHLDPNKHVLIANTVSYAKPRNIHIIGEGIENKEEIKILTDTIQRVLPMIHRS